MLKPKRVEIVLSQQARGRNGVFVAKKAIVLNMESAVEVCIDSKTKGYEHPIWFDLTPDEAEKLGQALLNAGSL